MTQFPPHPVNVRVILSFECHMFLSGQIAYQVEQHLMPGECPPPLPVAMQHPHAWSSARLTCPPAERFGQAKTAAGEQCLPLDQSSTAELRHGLGGGEWEATQDTGGWSRLGAGGRPLFCGVLGVVETAL